MDLPRPPRNSSIAGAKIRAVVPLSIVEVEVVREAFGFPPSGSNLVAIAAVAAALIAAYVAIRNHGKQLEHDQRMRDREHARLVVGSAIDRLVRAREVVAGFREAVRSLGVDRKRADHFNPKTDPPQMLSEIEATVRVGEKKARAADRMLRTLIPELEADSTRLGIFVGAGMGVSKHHHEAIWAIGALHDSLVNGIDIARIRQEEEDEERFLNHFHEGRNSFEAACREEFRYLDPAEKPRRFPLSGSTASSRP